MRNRICALLMLIVVAAWLLCRGGNDANPPAPPANDGGNDSADVADTIAVYRDPLRHRLMFVDRQPTHAAPSVAPTEPFRSDDSGKTRLPQPADPAVHDQQPTINDDARGGRGSPRFNRLLNSPSGEFPNGVG